MVKHIRANESNSSTRPPISSRSTSCAVVRDLAFQWSEGLGWVLGLFAIWGLVRDRSIRDRIGQHIWGTDLDTLGSVVGQALIDRGWRLAIGESLTGGEIARVLTETEGSTAWLAGAIVLPGADAASLERQGAAFGAEVLCLAPSGDAESTLIVRLPDQQLRQATVRYRTQPEGRRRATLAALDLIRRALI